MEIAPAVSSWVSTGVLVLLVFGLLKRHRRSIHIPVMLTSFAIDVANVVFIEIRRGAVEKAIATASVGGEWLLKFHVAVSLLTVVGYLLALWTGWRLHAAGRGRPFHRANAVFFLVNRVLNYATSFYV